MNIINQNADYSGTGLGKVPYISTAVATLLAASYPGLSTTKGQAFQAFIDNIGGLTGDMWTNKLKYMFIPAFATDLVSAMRDVKTASSTTPFVNLSDANKPTYYSLANGMLSQLGVTQAVNCRINYQDNWYKSSFFGAIKNDITLSANNITTLGYGSLAKTAGSTNWSIQKYDNVSTSLGNQTASVLGQTGNAVHTVAISGLQGIDAPSQNLLVVDGVQGTLVLKPSGVTSGTTYLGLIGSSVPTTTPGVEYYMMGYGLNFTQADTIMMEAATRLFTTAVIG